MSIRTNPAKAVPALLNRLTKTIQDTTDEDVSSAEKIKRIIDDIKRLEDRFPAVKQWQEKLLDQFSELDRHHRNIEGHDFSSMLNDIDADINEIMNLLDQLHAEPERNPAESVLGRHARQHQNSFQELSPLEKTIIANLDNNPIVKCLQVSYDCLDGLDLRICLLFLAIFPENAVLKKRLLIYWWIGEGLITTEEEGENKFEELLKLGLIIPHGNGKSPIVNKCQIHPWIRYMLIKVATEEKLLHFDHRRIPRFAITSSRRACLIGGDPKYMPSEPGSRIETLRTIFNVSESYLTLEPEWLARLKKLVVLHLGRWQVSPTHHIEVQGELFLKGLRTQKHLRYLSLRGISRITVLPSSIVELVSLEILDLKACHNLETLPADIASLRKLTHLDVSECYLLESMPKGLDKLTSLQALNGFIIGNSKKTPCRIGDLKNLEKLNRLSIHIGSEALIQPKELEKLEHLKSVRCLKISWGVVSQKRKEQVSKESLSFPPSLEKLDLEGIPQDRMPEWLKPSKLRQLKKLYIKGGELCSLDHDETDGWNVKILRLKYTKNLEIDLSKIREMFPSLEYVQKVGGDASEISEVESIDMEWSKESTEGSMLNTLLS